MNRGLVLTIVLSAMAWTMAAPPSRAQQATYSNPLLTAGRPADPHVIRVDSTYYLYATTHGRGYDVLVSQDLVNWQPKGRAFDDPRGGAWAPDVFHHKTGDGKFYLYYTDDDGTDRPSPEGKQIGVAVADSPLGPFKDQRSLVEGSIDAHLFRDDDGSLYLYYVRIVGGFKIMVVPMADPLTPRGEAAEVIHPTEPWEMASGHITEGPFMLKRDGVYFLMYSGSGADSPHYAIGYATAKSPLGPFQKHAGNPIAKRGDGIYGPGHHCVIEGPDGKLWMVYHQKADDRVNWRRFIAIDPLWFDDAGVIHTRLSRGVDQPAPAAGS